MTALPPPSALASVIFEWGDAYRIGYTRDQWAAWRRDTHRLITAATLPALEDAIQDDYLSHPGPRDYDPPSTAGYLDAPAGEPGHGLDLPDADTFPDEETALDEDTRTVLDHLRDTFPRWAISYSAQMRAWTARRTDATICQNSAVLLAIALTLIERKQRPASKGPNGQRPAGSGDGDPS